MYSKEGMRIMLTVGDQAPDFTLPNQSRVIEKLSRFLGQRVVLYFYPRDNTPACTKQAKLYADLLSDFDEQEAVVIGISTDSPESHTKFIDDQLLGQLLLSDQEAKVAQAYGVWQEKRQFGKVRMGIVRSTFVLDRRGRVVSARYKVKADDDARQVLQILDAMPFAM